MKNETATPKSFEEYFSGFPAEVQVKLEEDFAKLVARILAIKEWGVKIAVKNIMGRLANNAGIKPAIRRTTENTRLKKYNAGEYCLTLCHT